MIGKGKKRPWWRGAVGVLGWCAVLAVTYLIFARSDGSAPTAWYFIIGVLAFNYGATSISERLDTIIWTLEEIERKLPDTDPYL